MSDSNKLLQLITAAAPAMISLCSRDLRYVFVNRAYAKFFRRPPKQFIGQPIQTLLGAEAFAAIQPYIRTVLRGRSVKFEIEVTHGRLGPRFMQVVYRPDKDRQGRVHGWIAVLTDITESRGLEATLKMISSMPEQNPSPEVRLMQGRLVSYCNPAARRLLKDWCLKVGQEAPVVLRRAAQVAVAAGHPVEREVVVAGRCYVINLVPFGPGDYVNLYFSDITARKRVEEICLESETRFRAMAEAAPVLIWVAGPDKLCTYFNKGWLEFTGRPAAQERGKGWAAGVHPDDLSQWRSIYARAFAARQPFEREYRRRRHDGEYRWILERGAPRFTAAGKFAGYIGSGVDITERKRTEESLARRVAQRTAELSATHAALSEREELLYRLFQHAPDAVVVLDHRGRIVRANLQATNLFGYRGDELLTMSIEKLVPKHYRVIDLSYRLASAPAPEERSLVGLELFGHRRDGSEFPIDINLASLPRPEGTLVLAVIRDLTERKRIEHALAESHRTLQAVIDGSPLAIFTLDCAGLVQSWNRTAEALFGWTAAEVVGQPPALGPNCAAESRHWQTVILTAKQSVTFEATRYRKDGSAIEVNISGAALRNGLGQVTGYVAMLADITERKQLERQIIEVGESERERLGRDVHDGLSQQLTGISFMTEALRDRLGKSAPQEVPATEKLVRHVRRAVNLTHDLARGLYPVELTTEGLPTGLQTLASNMEDLFGVPCKVVCRTPVEIADGSVARHLYRIAQEAITNAAKHNGHQIRVALAQADGALTLTVADEGPGFTPVAGKSAGMGLHIMQYRAKIIGATLSVTSAPGHGTTVTCSLNSNLPPKASR